MRRDSPVQLHLSTVDQEHFPLIDGVIKLARQLLIVSLEQDRTIMAILGLHPSNEPSYPN
jgi:hypothetical protein